MSYNEQFKMARMPLKPLAYTDKQEAQTRELLIDYSGDNPTYNIYIVDPVDKTKIINITQLIINQGFPNINVDKIKININNQLNPEELGKIINEIYEKFLYPEDKNGFIYTEDKDKLFDKNTKGILLRDNNNIYVPVTTTDNVYGKDGKSIEDRLNSMTRLGFSTSCVRATIDNQTVFDIEYPFPNYLSNGNFIEIRIGSTYIDKARYYITENQPVNGNINGAKITFVEESIELGRAINLLFIYNSAASIGGDDLEYVSGRYIANSSIPTCKLEKVSDRYDLNDPTSISSSKATYNLYSEILNLIKNYSPMCIYSIDVSNDSNFLKINVSNFSIKEGMNINVRTIRDCKPKTIIINNIEYDIIDPATNEYINYNIGSNKLVKLIYSSFNNKFYINNLLHDYKLSTNRWIYTAKDADNVISFDGLEYDAGDQIFVYKNGNRLFEMVDYSLDLANERIYIFTRSEAGDRYIFESYCIERR